MPIIHLQAAHPPLSVTLQPHPGPLLPAFPELLVLVLLTEIHLDKDIARGMWMRLRF